MQPPTHQTSLQPILSAVNPEEEDKIPQPYRSRREKKKEISYRENNSEKSDFVRHLKT